LAPRARGGVSSTAIRHRLKERASRRNAGGPFVINQTQLALGQRTKNKMPDIDRTTAAPAPAPAAISKSWRDTTKIHPAANLFPMMSDEEIDALAADIKKADGLTSPIVFWNDEQNNEWLLDGRNRIEAAERAGYEIKGHEKYDLFDRAGDDPYAYVISANIQRRHLTSEKKRDLIANVLAADPDKSDRAVAKIAKVSKNTVASVRSEAEARGQIDHVDTRTDSKGRKQPARKPATKAKRAKIYATREAKKQAEKEDRTRQHEEEVAERKAAAAAFAVEIRDRIGIENFTWLAAGLMDDCLERFDRVDAIIDLAKGVNPWRDEDEAEQAADEAAEAEALAGNDPGPLPAALDRTVPA
jgi:hypothetical protein